MDTPSQSDSGSKIRRLADYVSQRLLSCGNDWRTSPDLLLANSPMSPSSRHTGYPEGIPQQDPTPLIERVFLRRTYV